MDTTYAIGGEPDSGNLWELTITTKDGKLLGVTQFEAGTDDPVHVVRDYLKTAGLREGDGPIYVGLYFSDGYVQEMVLEPTQLVTTAGSSDWSQRIAAAALIALALGVIWAVLAVSDAVR